jgi:4'-phosphopantetheinyl transferase
VKPESAKPVVQISLLDLDKISEDALTPFLDWLNPLELARYERFQRVLRKRQFLAGRVVLRWSLMQMMNLPRHDIQLTERPDNAPLLQLDGVELTPEFSLSHTGNWVACAWSTTTRLGLDIEMLDAKRELQGVARHSFSDDELAWMQRAPDLVAAFYFLWSRREARYKLTQNHVSAGVEHCHALSHPDLSMVLMTEVPLAEPPHWSEVDWHKIKK